MNPARTTDRSVWMAVSVFLLLAFVFPAGQVLGSEYDTGRKMRHIGEAMSLPDTDTTLEQVADVEVSVSASPVRPSAGEEVTVTITVRNAGDSGASGLKVFFSSEVPGGVSLANFIPGQGSFDNGTSVWTVGSLSAGQSAEAVVTGTFTGNERIAVFSANLIEMTEADGDSTPGNLIPTEDDYDIQSVVQGDYGSDGGSALVLAGDDDFVEISDSDALDLTGTFTLMGWVKPDAGASGHVISHEGSSGDTGGAYNIKVNGTDVTYATNNEGFLTATDALDAGQWNHIAVVHDSGSSQNTSIYVNGALVATSDVPSPSALGTSVVLGRRGLADSFFEGQFDEISFWNTALTRSDVRSRMLDPLSGSESGLVAYYRFDDGDSSTAIDGSGNDHNGELTNGAGWTDSTLPMSGLPDLSMDVESDISRASAGDEIDFTVTVSNDSPAATGLVIEAFIANGDASIAASTAHVGTYDSGTNRWTISQLGGGESATLDITVTSSESSDAIVLNAEIIAAHQRDKDADVGSGDARDDTFAYRAILPDLNGSGQALSLDGSDDFVQVFDDDKLDTPDAITMEAWVYVTRNDHVSLATRTDDGRFDTGSYGINFLSDGRIEWDVKDFGSTTSPSGSISRNTWHHVAVSFDNQATPNVVIYVDGNIVHEASTGGENGSLIPPTSDLGLVIGSRGQDLFFGGRIDEFAYWNVARTPEQILEGLLNPLTGTEAGLIVYHRYDVKRNLGTNDDGADDAQDHSGTGLHGDLENGADILDATTPKHPNSVSATDDIFEDHVLLSWDLGEEPATLVQIVRDGQLLDVVSSDDDEYADEGSTPNRIHVYCVVTENGGGARTTLGCDGGRRRLLAATSVSATDEVFTDRIEITWDDDSVQNTGYNVYRDNTLIASVGPNTEFVQDTEAEPETAYNYCVVPTEDGVEGNLKVCDEGLRADALPAKQVAATDGTVPGLVRVTWLNQGDGTTGFEIRRDGTLISTVDPDVTSFDDTSPTAGTVHTYCVRRTVETDSAIDICDEGSINTLPDPGDVAATDRGFDDRVEVTWDDNTHLENGYRVYRTGGAAFSFDGVNDVVRLGADTAFERDEMTLEAWVRPTAFGSTRSIFQKGDPRNFDVLLLGDGRLHFAAHNRTCAELQTLNAAAPLLLDAWSHIAVSVSTSQATLYVNGVQVGQEAISGTCVTDTAPAIGGDRFDSFAGAIDEMRLWRGSRTESQVRELLYTRLTGEEDGLIAYWPFDVGRGLGVDDEFGIHQGTLANVDFDDAASEWTTETAPFVQYGTGLALSFDGEDDYARVEDAAALDLDTFTLETWLNPASGADGEQLLIGKMADTGAVRNYTFVRLDNGHVRLVMSPGNCSDQFRPFLDSTAPVPTGQWTHTAVTFDGSMARLYVNGVLDREVEALAPICNNDEPLLIGGGLLGEFHGSLDRTRIWNVALPADDIADRMHKALTGTEEGLVMALSFDNILDEGVGAAGFNDVRDMASSLGVDLIGGPTLVQGTSSLLARTSVNTTTFVDLEAQPGIEYVYCVATFTNLGVETAGVCDTGSRSPALEPENVQATDAAFEDRIDISWASSSTRTSVFKIYRDESLIKTVPFTTLSFTDEGIPSDTDLEYCVSAVSAGGTESATTCDVGSRSIAVPTQVDASNGEFEARVDITWVDESEIERGYRVYRRELLDIQTGELAADSSLVAETVASQTETTDRAGVPGTTYRYSVVAFDEDGHSKIGFKSGLRRLRTPANVSADDGERETFVNIVWEDRSQVENGYRILRDGSEIATVDKNISKYTDNDPPFGKVVTYSVEAFDDLGSSERGEDTGSTRLLKPGSVSASDAFQARINITWVDRSTVETGYRIYRNGQFLSEVDANHTSYQDETTSTGTNTYCVATVSGSIEAEQECDTGIVWVPEEPPSSIPLEHTLTQHDGESPDEYGIRVAIAGDQMMVGALFHNERAGAVYVYERQSSGWVFRQKLIASDSKPNSRFGNAIDMTSSWAIIGSPRHTNKIGSSRVDDDGDPILASSVSSAGQKSDFGRVYFFKRTPDGWEERQAFTHDFLNLDANYGAGVSTDGNFALVTAPGDESLYIMKRSGDDWLVVDGIGSTLGERGAIDGDLAVLATTLQSSPGYIIPMERVGENWSTGSLISPVSLANGGGSFGVGVDMDLGIIAVGSHRQDAGGGPSSGAVYVYEVSGKNDVEQIQLLRPDEGSDGLNFGKSVAVSRDRILVGADNTAFLFERDEDGVYQETSVYSGVGASPDFGRNVALSPEGMIVVGDPAGFGHPAAGQVFFVESDPHAPADVAATNGKFENRVELSWSDRSDNEDGFQIFRDGELIETTEADITGFSDVNSVPGNVHEYCVQAIRAVYGNVSEKICDIGWRFPDGAISGKVTSGLGDPAQNIEVCISPTPNGSIALDGFDGEANTTEETSLPESFSIEFWAKRSASGGGNEAILFHGEQEENKGLIAGFDDDQLLFGFWKNNLKATAESGIDWHHYAMTFDHTTGRRIMYVDGDLHTQDISNSSYQGHGGISIGHVDGKRYFAGQVDEIRIWDHVRTEQQIQARMFQTVDPTEPNLGLFIHWALDERGGNYSANDVDESGSFYLHHNGGVHPARPGAPIIACDITDQSGDYSFTGIRYGESTEYTLNPQDPGDFIRTFKPNRKIITLNRQNPVQNEVPFTDLTKYTVAGTIQFDGTECPVSDAVIDANTVGAQATRFETDDGGDFSAAVDPGSSTIEPSVAGDPTRIFTPELYSYDLKEDVFEQNFVDKTLRTLSGQFVGTGQCRLPIGRATLEIRARNGCLVKEVVTDENGNYSVELPPMEYTVALQSVENDDPIQRVDIEEFFEEQGPQIVDLSDENVEHDLIYRAPLKVQIAGMPATQCNTGDIPNGLPVLAKADPLDLSITVVEDLGDAGSCPVDTGTVTLFSEISDQTNTPLELAIPDDGSGTVDTTLVVGQPNVLAGRVVDGVDRSYQKFITAAADVDGTTAEATEWAIVEGVRPRPGGRFATTPETPVPTLILRDPPGDGSYAYLTEGSEMCSTISTQATLEVGAGADIFATVGAVIDVGVAFGGEASLVLEQTATAGLSVDFWLRRTIGGGVKLCSATSKRIQTSDDDDWTGAPADLFVGAGMNFIFAKADRVTVDECQIDVDDTIAFGPKLETGFVFTREHIQNRMIPDLVELRDATTSPDSMETFQTGIENWNRMLADSDETKNEDGLDAFEEDQRNRSFNAGADFSFARSGSTLGTFFTNASVGVSSSQFIGQKIDVAGNSLEQIIRSHQSLEVTLSFQQTWGSSSEIGYRLSDDDGGDNFTTDILTDPKYGTPVFDVKAGLSSCPYEPWEGLPLVVAEGGDPNAIQPRVTPRDVPSLSMNPITRQGLNPNEPAAFTVNIGNQSASDELRNYLLTSVRGTNPGGALIAAGGQSVRTGDGPQFAVPPGEVQQTALTVKRGPERYDYPRLGLALMPVCDQPKLEQSGPFTADTLFFDVGFTPPCSDISIFRPKENWALTRQTINDPVEIILNDFTLSGNDVDEGVQRIAVEYRKVGTSDWLPAFSASREDIVAQGGADADSYIRNWTFPDDDGLYELRAFTECDNGKNYSDTVLGRVDTVLPEIIGTPEPADGVLGFGENISVTLNEPVLCSSIISGGQSPNTTMTRLDTNETLAIEATCDGRLAVITTQDPDILDELEGGRVAMFAEGWTDLAGNPLEDPVEWEFEIRRSAFTWSPTSASMTLALGATGSFEATLTNGKPSGDINFELSGYDEWLVPNVTQGTVPAASQATVGFTVRDVLNEGTHETTVTATNSDGDESVLTLTVEVFDQCIAPSWAVTPSNFQHNMTVTAQLFVDGVVSKDDSDRVAAFVDDQLRGVASVSPLDSDNDGTDDANRVNLVVYSNQSGGEQVTFKAWDESECTTYEESGLTLSFDATAVHGTPEQPISLLVPPPPPVAGDVPLSSGWTWFSINVEPTDARVGSILAQVSAAEADIVKSQRFFSLFDPTAGWVGTLAELDPRAAYLIKLNQSHTLSLNGAAIDPQTNPLDLVTGWNWIGFLPQDAIEVNEALATLEPATNDIIKSQFEFAQFVQGSGWIGSLTTMEPGLGYQIRLAENDELTYPAAGSPAEAYIAAREEAERAVQARSSREDHIGEQLDADAKTDLEGRRQYVDDRIAASESEAVHSKRASSMKVVGATTRDEDAGGIAEEAVARISRMKKSQGLDCSVNPADFQYSLTLTAFVTVDGTEARSEAIELGAFAGDTSVAECRGLGKLQYIESLDRYLAFVVVYSNSEGENINLRVFDSDSDRLMDTDKVLTFASNGVFGTVQNPVDVNATSISATAAEDPTLPTEFGLESNFPNPFSQLTRIRYSLPRAESVTLTVYDVLGRRVATLVQKDHQAGRYETVFDAGNLAPGTYAYRLEAGSYVDTKVMVLMR